MATPLTLIIRYISTAISGCVLMMWGVINFSLQLRSHFAAAKINSDEIGSSEMGDWLQQGWTYSWIMATVTGLIPLAIGVILLRGILKEASRAKQLMG